MPLGCNQGGLFTMSSLRSSLPSVSLSSMGASYIPTPSFGLGTRISMRTASSSSSGTSLGNLTSTGDVERFIQMKIQPDSDYLRMCNSTVDRIVHLLQNNIPEHLRPSEVVKVTVHFCNILKDKHSARSSLCCNPRTASLGISKSCVIAIC